jgi:hypothetical protein
MDILGAAHELEGEALVNSVLAWMRYRVLDGLLGATEWAVAIKRAYSMTVVNTAHDETQKLVLLTAGLFHRSALELPWPCLAKDIFKAVLEAHEDLQYDWNNTTDWYDAVDCHQY